MGPILSGFNTHGTPCTGLGHQAQLGRVTDSCLSDLSPKIGPIGRQMGSAATTGLGEWTRDVDLPLKGRSCLNLSLTGYRGHPYP
jgi:hypothetical protein